MFSNSLATGQIPGKVILIAIAAFIGLAVYYNVMARRKAAEASKKGESKVSEQKRVASSEKKDSVIDFASNIANLVMKSTKAEIEKWLAKNGIQKSFELKPSAEELLYVTLNAKYGSDPEPEKPETEPEKPETEPEKPACKDGLCKVSFAFKKKKSKKKAQASTKEKPATPANSPEDSGE